MFYMFSNFLSQYSFFIDLHLLALVPSFVDLPVPYWTFINRTVYFASRLCLGSVIAWPWRAVSLARGFPWCNCSVFALLRSCNFSAFTTKTTKLQNIIVSLFWCGNRRRIEKLPLSSHRLFGHRLAGDIVSEVASVCIGDLYGRSVRDSGEIFWTCPCLSRSTRQPRW